MNETIEATETITIENREVDVTITAPSTMLLGVLGMTLPDAIIGPDAGEAESATFQELHDTCVSLVGVTTDLPSWIIEELPAKTVQRLAATAIDVIEEREREKEQKRAIFGSPFDSSGTGTTFSTYNVDTEDDLTKVSGVGTNKADELQLAGYSTIDDLREASQSELADVESIGNALAARIKADVGFAEQ